MREVKTNHPDFIIDWDSGAVINKNTSGFGEHKAHRQALKEKQLLRAEVDDLKVRMLKLEQLLYG